MEQFLRFIAVPVFAVALAGCSSSGASDQGDAAAEPQVASSSESSAVATAENDSGTADAGDSADPAVPVGEWANYESTTHVLDVRVTDTSCGHTALEDAVQNVEWDGVDMGEAFTDAEAEQGNVFCVVTYDVKNSGSEPVEFPYPPATITTDIGKSYMPTVDEESMAYSMLAHRNGEEFYSYPPLNPDDQQERLFVVQIPDGAAAVSISYPNESRVLGTTMEQLTFAL